MQCLSQRCYGESQVCLVSLASNLLALAEAFCSLRTHQHCWQVNVRKVRSFWLLVLKHLKSCCQIRDVNANSNHPPSILEKLPTMVNIGLSSSSINEDEFNEAKLLNKKVRNSSSFNKNLKFKSIQTNTHEIAKGMSFGSTNHIIQKWKRTFLKLVGKHFHKGDCYKKIFNTNIINLRYACTPAQQHKQKQQILQL